MDTNTFKFSNTNTLEAKIFQMQVQILLYTGMGGRAQFIHVLFDLPCYLQFELETHIIEVSF